MTKFKISILWLAISLGWVIHHLYGLFNIYYKESLMMEGATGDTPLEHHLYRVAFEGIAFLFGILSLEVSQNWFKWAVFVWAIIGGFYNVYHLVTAFIYESTNISELFMLLNMVIVSGFLVKSINTWRQETEASQL